MDDVEGEIRRIQQERMARQGVSFTEVGKEYDTDLYGTTEAFETSIPVALPDEDDEEQEEPQNSRAAYEFAPLLLAEWRFAGF